MRTKQGYCGYYKNIWLRSSYEFALVKYFEYFNIKFSYESIRLKYTIDNKEKVYIPDFIVGTKIYETKSEKDVVHSKFLLELIKTSYGYEYEIISLNELKELYKTTSMNLLAVIAEWKNSSDTNLNINSFGNNNPHFGLKHSEETKKVLSRLKKEQFENNPSMKEKSSFVIKKMIRAGKIKRFGENYIDEKRICKRCGSDFFCIPSTERKIC